MTFFVKWYCAHRVTLGMSACAFWLACTTPAEHSNPLDPDSPAYTQSGAMRVRVTTYYPPYQALAGARIRLLPSGVEVQSDAEGQYTFRELESGDYAVIASKAGYDTVQLAAQVLVREVRTLDLRLDALPVVASAQITGARIATREAATPRLFLEINAEITDPDGANDVVRARAKISGRATADSLARGLGISRWERTIASDELAPLNLHNLVGMPVAITAEDGAGKSAAPVVVRLARIIDEEPLPISPSNGDVPPNPSAVILRWQLPAISFDHTFNVEIFRWDAGFPAQFFTARNVRAGTNALPYPGRLSSGTYYWTVKIVDGFGNSSRSKEATFQVQ